MINGYGRFLTMPFAVMAVVMFCVVAPGSGWAAPIGARAVYVEGKVTLTPAGGGGARAVAVGDSFAEGDRVMTGADGAVEIEFDTGDLIKLTAGTDMVIKALHRNKQGSTFNIFNLALGRVKSMVSKLADKSSRFEYHTRTAIAGVAGTPPWVVTAFEEKTEVDLLGDARVYVMGENGELVPIEEATYTQRDGRLFGPDGREVDPENLQPMEQAGGNAPNRYDDSVVRRYVLEDGRLVRIREGDEPPPGATVYTQRNGRMFGPDGREVDPENLQPMEQPGGNAPNRHDDSHSDERHYVLKNGELVPIEQADVYVERDGQLYDLRGHPVGRDGQPIRRTTQTHNDSGHPGGAVYVQGLDPAKTSVILHPGFRTVVHMGKAPRTPFGINADRFRKLKMIPFKSFLQGRKSSGGGGAGHGASVMIKHNDDRSQMVVESIDRRVSVPRNPRGGRSGGQEELENQYNQGQGFAGPGSSNGNGLKTPALHHGKLGINLN